MARVAIHRFREEVAIAVTGVGGETVYLSPSDALKLATGIRKAALSCKRETFAASQGLTLSVDARRQSEPRKAES